MGKLIEIDLEPYLDQMDEDDLIDELKRRGFYVSEKYWDVDEHLDEADDLDLIDELESRGYSTDPNQTPEFTSDHHKLSYIKDILGLKKWHDMNRVI